jgi:formylglycine-generating enzyme required for sulfatase activity
MVKIYVSYFPEDSQAYSDRIYGRLQKRFSRSNITRDIDVTEIGHDIRASKRKAIDNADIVLVIINKHWLTLVDEDGNRRIDNLNEPVRIELEYALQRPRDCDVVPILINKFSQKLNESKLPQELKSLAHLPPVFIRDDPDFHTDIDKIIKEIEKIEEKKEIEKKVTKEFEKQAHHIKQRNLWIIAITILIILGAVFIISTVLLNNNNGINTTSETPTYHPLPNTEVSINTEVVLFVPPSTETPSPTPTPTEPPSHTPTSTDIPSHTLTPTETPNYPTRNGDEADLTNTAQAYIEETAIKEAILTSISVTLTAHIKMTNTPTPDNTTSNPIPVSTPTSIATMNIPYIENNQDWEPFESTFDGIVMVLVPKGCFFMGDWAVREYGIPYEECIDTPFWIDKFEVSRAQYQDCIDDVVCSSPQTRQESTQPNQPINIVDWLQAKTYCEWRGGRLLTEVEWEYAASGPSNYIYPWGNDFIPENVVYHGNSDGQTALVGSRLEGASWVGALDMAGNVEEWISSLQVNYPHTPESENDSDRTTNRILRGGSFRHYDELRTFYRLWRTIISDGTTTGIRCAKSFTTGDHLP